MKKVILLMAIMTSSTFSFAAGQESYECRYDYPSDSKLVLFLEYSGRSITTSLYDEKYEDYFVKDAPCDELPTGNMKSSVVCTDEEGGAFNIVLDKTTLKAEINSPWLGKEPMSCVLM